MSDCPRNIRHDMKPWANGHWICKHCGYHVHMTNGEMRMLKQPQGAVTE